MLRNFRILVSAAAALILFPAPAPAGPPEIPAISVIQQKIDNTLTILHDTDLQKPESLSKLRRRLVEELEPLFVFREMTVRALGSHARELQPEQIDKLTRSFKTLLERIYIDRLTANLVKSENPYRIVNIRIIDQEIQGNYTRVNTKATIEKNGDQTDLFMNYRLVKRAGQWSVYDFEIEGISLIENYRSQFNDILTNNTFDYLLKSIDKNLETMDQPQPAKSKDRKAKIPADVRK